MSQNESPAAGAEAAPDKATFIAKKTTAGIFALFLGGLGVHKFYLGFTTPGLIMCLVSIIGGILTCGLACIPIGIIALIEGIMYLTKSDDEFYQLYAVEKKGWF